jgi:hypothetical protein
MASNRVYLAVPYCDKNEAKDLGAKWDKKAKQWYAPKANAELTERWPINETEIALMGEDRTFGGDDLFVDLIPSTCWFTNVRYCVHPSEWDRLRRHVYERAGDRCESCKLRRKLEAHERWSYNDETKVQKLERLVALCRKCHGATHMGFSKMKGKGDEAREHLKKCRKFTDSELDQHIQEASQLWRLRNKTNWELDLTLMTNNGIRLVKDGNEQREVRRQMKEPKADAAEEVSD